MQSRCAIRLVVMLGLVLFSGLPAMAQQSYFEMTETESGNLNPFTKWTGVMKRFRQQMQIPDSSCGTVRFHPCVIGQWKEMLQNLKSKPLSEQLDAVNEWGNKHPYIIDQLNWGMQDYWETPYEFMEISGDCEDYAIAKYFTLRNMGIPADDMRIIILQDFNLGGIIHAVLGVYDGDELLILDNQSPRVTPALRIYHYRPIYGVNEDGWWAYHPRRTS